MYKLDQFVTSIKKSMPNDLNTLSIARYISVMLGNLVCFDPNYVIANQNQKNVILRSIVNQKECLEGIFLNKYITCKSITYIYSYILSCFNILSYSSVANDDSHIYNILKIDSELYAIDLQLDLVNIKAKLMPRFFAFGDLHNTYTTLSNKEVSSIDKKIGLIQNMNDYTDLKIQKLTNSFSQDINPTNITYQVEKVLDFVNFLHSTEYMGPFEINNFYIQLFSETLHSNIYRKLHFAFCYKNANGKMSFLSILSINGTSNFYILHPNGYIKIEQKRLLNILNKGFKISLGQIVINNRIYNNKKQKTFA